MGATYAELKITNLFNKQSVEVNALVETGATFMCVTEEEPLMGVLPLEAMDLMVDPLRQQLAANPAHPNFPVASAK